ncbi:MAG: hypothetical protein KZQ70_01225 [gamma proteobacterium symbiont of Lucinoma myriamae]|nr:hypothetical protein [gamma proteobacterium symbiont of Lucinoma myriamae]MCU7818688.1 hypothetical protein [gamma proteobacterium symbiont of Lucinoma myriamae]MCU7831174.1 hypothetical protein [gamma proteobacterium symbiont of Lucinoma myriamae]
MDNTTQASDKLLQEIIQLEVEVDKVMALNGNREDFVVKQYRKFIQAKRNRLTKINYHYKDQFNLPAH